VLPLANTRAIRKHLDEINRNAATQARGVVLMDSAEWRRADKLKVPKYLTIILLSARSPKLNPVKSISLCLRQNWLSNCVFEDYDAIVEAGSLKPGNTRCCRTLAPACISTGARVFG
jgi:hypothetical protein